MSNPVVPGRLSFEENLNILLEELTLAGRWGRPSILLAIHKSKFGQDKAEQALEYRLAEAGQGVTRITVDEAHSDVPHLMMKAPGASQSVFFVSNLGWGGGSDRKDAYRALNIYREILVDNHLRLVLWLTTNEAATLARFAPDFWSFRHRVIEFTGQRIPRQVKLPAGVLLWDVQNSVDPFDTLQARIAVREQLLAKLPQSAEARSSRIDLLYTLGYLHWTAGETQGAAKQLEEGLQLATGAYAEGVRASLLNGLAIIRYEAQDYAGAVELLQQALQEGPGDALVLINLSAASNALGRNQEADRLSRQAVRLKPGDARIWGAQGYIYAAMGKFDEAIASFGKAVEILPRSGPYHAALAICYDLVEGAEDAARELELARKLASDQALVSLDIYHSLLSGNMAGTQDLLRSAVQAGGLSWIDLRRDPSLSLLMDPAQIGDIPA